MKKLFLYDDARARTFEPFSLTRPVSELVAGAALIRRRWELCAGTRASSFIAGEQLRDFEELDAPRSVEGDEVLAAGSVIANSRCAIALRARLGEAEGVWLCDGEIAAVRLSVAMSVAELDGGEAALAALPHEGVRAEIAGRWLTHVWDLIAQLSAQLTEDITVLAESVDRSTPHATLGNWPALIQAGATVEPNVIFDTNAGPVLVRAGATVAAFTRLVGPCYVERGATVLGDRVSGCYVGESCKLRGEMSSSVMLGHSNKGHTGFVGHSYMGRWVNLGSGTTTSNLKNTYGPVQLWTPEGMADTGLQFLGTMFGDHVKTGIGTMLSTGTVLGAGASIHGANMPPKVVQPFSWGDGAPYATYDLARFLDVAARVAARRGITLTERQMRQLALAHRNRWSI